MRPWTPDRVREEGGIELSVKRACNGCGQLLGDVTDREMADAIRGLPLFDVTAECGRCQGLHMILVKPEPWDARVHPYPSLVAREIEIICPGIPKGSEILPCASYEPCGCEAPDNDPLTVEFQEFLKQRCPVSPTGEHQHLGEAGFVGAPTGGCWYRLADKAIEAADDEVTTLGLYAVEVGAFDDVTPTFEVVDLSKRKAATPV